MQKIFLLERAGFPEPAEMKTMVVIAKNEDNARHFAAGRRGSEISSVWTDPKTAVCRDIGVAHENMNQGVVMANRGVTEIKPSTSARSDS